MCQSQLVQDIFSSEKGTEATSSVGGESRPFTLVIE